MTRHFLRSRQIGSRTLRLAIAFAALILLNFSLSHNANAQDNDDPPGRAARLGHMDGSVSFQPAGESEWVEAAPNRPMTTGDKLWADRNSRAEVELGSASMRLDSNTGFSFINLDDRTVQIQLSSGVINLRVRRLDRDDVMEIDTPNQAFSVVQPGQYRVEASEDGTYTVVTVRDGEGEATGNGQTYTVHEGQRATFSGTDRLNAEVRQVGNPDDFDRWCDGRDRRFDDSRSSRYVSRDVVGAEDLDEYGDWQPYPEYGNVWYPRVQVGWAPYHTGHWAWIDPWGWTWVDEAPWGYAPFHYGRWAFISNRWGWIPGPIAVRPVYAPALVVFVGGRGPGFGGNVAWFALGPREVYVPSYRVSPGYVNRVNISNTTVNQTTITNVYNTTIVNKTTVINNVRYVNRGVSGAVTAVPQNDFARGQSVSRTAVRVDPRQLESASMNARAPVAPARTAVMGLHADTANRVAAPPQAVQNRAVIAKASPPPPPVSFAARQQTLRENPGQPIARQEMQRLRPASAPVSQPLVRQAPPGRPATPNTAPNMARPGSQPGNPQPSSQGNPAANDRPGMSPMPGRPQPPNQPAVNQPTPNNPAPGNPPANRPPTMNAPTPNTRPDDNRPQPNQPNRPFEPPSSNNRPPSAQPNDSNRPQPNQPEPNRPQPSQPANQPPVNRPPTMNAPTPNARPEDNRPQPNQPNRPLEPPSRNERPSSAQPNNRPEPARPQPSQPQTDRPADKQDSRTPPPNNRPDMSRPENKHPEPTRPEASRPPEQPRNQPAPRQQNPPQSERSQPTRQPEAAPQPERQPQRQQSTEEKKHESEQHKNNDEKPKPPGKRG